MYLSSFRADRIGLHHYTNQALHPYATTAGLRAITQSVTSPLSKILTLIKFSLIPIPYMSCYRNQKTCQIQNTHFTLDHIHLSTNLVPLLSKLVDQFVA